MKNSIFNAVCKTRYLALLVVLILTCGNVWGAENDPHAYSFLTSLDENWSVSPSTNNFYSTYGANWLRNNNATMPTFTFTPSYSVKKVRIQVRQSNKTGGTTIAVSIGGTTVGSTTAVSGTSQYNMDFSASSSLSGEVRIVCTNTSGSGSSKGTFYVASITLTEGASATTYDVHWNINGVTEVTTNTSGKPTVPLDAKTAAEEYSCNGKVFMGWTSQTVSGSAPSDLFTTQAGSAISGETTYDAVFATLVSEEERTPATLSFSYSSHANWTLYQANDRTSYYLLQKNCYVESPTISDLSTVTSVVLGVGKFSNKGAGEVSSGNTSYGTFAIPGSTSSNTVTLNPSPCPLSGSGKIRITNTDGTTYDANSPSGTRLYTVTINYATVTPAVYSDYSTTCCTPLGTINGSINLTQLATPDPTKLKATWTMNAETGIASYTLEVYDSSDNLVKTVNNYTSGAEITGLTPCTEYYVKLYTVSSGSPYCDGGLIGTSSSATTNGYTLSVTKTNVTMSSGSEPANICANVSATYAASSGYNLPSTITVTNAGAENTGWTWDSSTGVLTINKASVTGNVTVTITGEAQSYFPNNKTLFFEAKTKEESAWKDNAQCKAWFRDCNSGCGEAPWTYWQTDGDSNKKYYAVVIPSTGNYPYVTIQRFSDYTGNTQWGEGGAQTYSTGGGSNVIKSTCASGECLSWSPTSMQIYLRGDITNDDWASNIGEMTDQNGGIWSYTYTNYSSSGSTLAFKLYTNYNTWIGHTSSNNNATLDGMNDGSTYNITATYNIVDHSLVMSKTFVKGTVHFDLQGHGSAISDLTNVAANSKISAPTVPTDENYIFGGWYKEPGCTNAWDFTNDVVTETMTLYAKWYQVTLAVKDEDGTTLSGDGKPTLTRSGASLTATEAGNYVFKDIQVTSGTGTLSSTSSTTPTITSVSSNITVTATFWKPITVTKGTGTGASTFTISATTVARGGSVTVTCAPDASHKNPWTLTITPNDGATYTASGSESSTTISNITKNITVDLAYAAKTPYSLTFSTKSGYGSPSGGKIDETNLSFNASGTVTTPLLEGQTLTFPSVSSFAADECSTTFEGWSTEPNCSTAPTIKSGDELVLSGDPTTRTYYAVYSQTEEGGGDDFDPSEDVDGDFYITEKNKGYYATNTIAENVISTVTNKDNASKYHIESVIVSGDRRFILSTLVNTTTKYLVMETTGSGQSKQNTLTTTETKNDATKFEITEGAEGTNGTWQVGYNGTRGLMYRTYTPSGQSTVYRFGNYAFSNASSTGYSLLEFEPAASKTYTTNPTCTETFTVTLTGGEGASVDVTGGNVKYNGGTAARFAENDAVSISATPSTGYSFSGWTITKEGGGSVTPASSAASTTFTMPADNVTVTATFSPILVSSLKLRAQQTGQSDKTGSDLTMNCYPKEGQTGGNDPLSHTLNVAFYEVLPADALDKTYTWSVRVKVSGAADWTNVDFTGNQLNTNAIINYYNNNTGLLKIGTNEGTAEIKITANDASGVSAKVTITVAKVSVTSISVDPTSMNVYAGQKKPVTITFTPLNASDKAYTTGSYSYVTIRSSGSNPFYIEGNATEVVHNETVTVTSDDGSKTATVTVTVNPLPKATFVDIVQNKTDFIGVPSTGILSSTVDEGGLTVTTTKNTPTHADVAKPATGNNCEKEHLHLVGWILKDWADENPDATSAQIAAAGAGYFYAAGSEIDLVAKDGKTFYAVWAKEVTTP